jgi:hypothetical protein
MTAREPGENTYRPEFPSTAEAFEATARGTYDRLAGFRRCGHLI